LISREPASCKGSSLKILSFWFIGSAVYASQ
jgi:hypothetical protein